jgi:broad specificity phosphatase PhoE
VTFQRARHRRSARRTLRCLIHFQSWHTTTPRRGGASTVPTVFFITHPDVVIDPSVSVPDWPLSEIGRARMRAVMTCNWASGVRRIFASGERKARDAAQLLAEGLGLGSYSVIADLGENDRSATGFLAKDEFEMTVDAFFARPQESVRGCEPAADAQARIVSAVERVVSQAPAHGNIAVIGHGGTGTLLYCHLAGLPIDRRYDQPATNGGNWFAFVSDGVDAPDGIAVPR